MKKTNKRFGALRETAVLKSDQAGISLILTSIFIVVFLTCVAVILSLGYQARNMAAIQSIANSIAVGSLERVLRNPSEDMATRTQAARDWAEEVMNENALKGAAPKFGDTNFLKFVEDSTYDPNVDAGRILFGNSFREDPHGTGALDDPCGGINNYPCFVPNLSHTDPAETINSVRVDIRNASNPFVAPLAALLGISAVRVDAVATATVAQRCTIFLLDLGSSTMSESYLFTGPTRLPNSPPNVIGSLFAVRNSRMQQQCQSPAANSTPFPPEWPEAKYFCSPAEKYTNYVYPWDVDLKHYRKNYRKMDTSIQKMWIDDYYDPADAPIPRPFPLSYFLLGFNAGARLLAEQNTSSDRIAIIGFDRSVTNRRRLPLSDLSIPQFPNTPDAHQMTPDIGRIAMLTDIRRMGWRDKFGVQVFPDPERMPNLVDSGLFPVSFQWGTGRVNGAGTDIVEALDTAIEVLATSCPNNQRKRIVMATDGTPSCSHVRGISGSGTCPPVTRGAYGDFLPYSVDGFRVKYGYYGLEYGNPSDIDPGIDTYAGIEHLLLTERLDERGILRDLRELGISLSVMMRGEYIGPNVKNFARQNPNRYLTLDEARSETGFAGINFGGSAVSEDKLLFKTSSILPDNFKTQDQIRSWARVHFGTIPPCVDQPNWEDACAFTFAGEVAGVKFRRPIGVFGHLALRTGGQFSPLFPVRTNPADCYDSEGNLKDEFPFPGGDERWDCRSSGLHEGLQNGEGPPLEWSLHNYGPGYDAAALVRSAIGSNPYILDDLRCEGSDC